MTSWRPTEIQDAIAAMARYARALTRDAGTAEDLVQDALVDAYERADSFRPGASLRAWLSAIVHNRFVSDQRRLSAEGRRDRRFAEQERDRQAGQSQETAAYLRQISARFDSLPEPQRAVLHLVAVEGLSYQETAEALSIPVGTVMSRLSRARGAMRAIDGTADTGGLRIVGGRDAG